MIYDVIIIGAGPAGMSAAIYTARQELKTLILSKDIGGQTATSWEIENYLGFHLISGTELTAKFQEHLKDFKEVKFKVGIEVNFLEKQNKIFLIKTKDNQKFTAKTIIIASGKVPQQLIVPGEKEFRGKGVTYCATCDAPLFKNKIVAVIGGGDSALEAAYQLTKIAKKIYLLNRNPKFKEEVDKILLDNVSQAKNVKIIYNSSITTILGDKFVRGLEFQDLKSKKKKKLEIQGIFIEIGSVPAVDFCKNLIKLNQGDEIIIDKHNMTTVPGIFAAGDVTNVVEKQIAIAVGEGAKAAIGAAAYLSRHKVNNFKH